MEYIRSVGAFPRDYSIEGLHMTDTDATNAAVLTARLSTTSPPTSPSGEFLTRRQAADYIRDQLGRPMSFSTAQKLAALGEFAQAALHWGRRPLYRREDLRDWADARSRYDRPKVTP